MIEAAGDGWRQFLAALDRERAVLSGEDTCRWPASLLDELVAAGLLVKLAPAKCIACAGCSEAPFREVVFTQSANGRSRAFIPCPNCGLYQVPLEALQRWQVERGALLDRIGPALGLTGGTSELASARLWRLGRLRRGDLHWSIWFGLRLALRDAAELASRAQPSPRTLLIVPGRRPSFAPPPNIAIASLREVTTWSEGTIRWDPDLLGELLQIDVPAQTTSKKPAPARRQSRAGDIEALIDELSQHLRAARDYAFHTRDTQGAATLLPRPSQKDLARRLGITQSRVSRSLNDPRARQLQLLWRIAADLDEILRYAAR